MFGPKCISAWAKYSKFSGNRLYTDLVALTGVHKQIQETCRAFAEKELKPNAAQLDRECLFPHDQVKALSTLGLMGICAPEKAGGSELDTLALSIAVEEISRGCASTGLVVSIHNSLVVSLLTKFHRYDLVQPLCRGDLAFFALSESNAGSDVANLSTVATKDGGKWFLSGEKAWVTSAREAKSGIVFATIDPKLKHRGICAFYVRTNSPGVQIGPNEDKLGVRATSTCIYTSTVVPLR